MRTSPPPQRYDHAFRVADPPLPAQRHVPDEAISDLGTGNTREILAATTQCNPAQARKLGAGTRARLALCLTMLRAFALGFLI
ncbi:MAG TPA: hypothetical protein VLS52_00130 [Rudaea sp.]|nr:hypothetical protein [Rudaea sp.]